MSTHAWGNCVLGLISGALLAFVLGGSVLAEETTPAPTADVAERLAALQVAVSEHKRAKDSEGLLGDVRQIVALHAEAKHDEKVRKASVKLLGGLTRGGRICSTVSVAAIEGLGKTADPEGSRYLTARLRRAGNDREAALVRAAVAAAQQLCTNDLIDPLLKIVTDSKDYTLAAQAVQTLGYFRHCKRKRAKILKALCVTVAKDRPGAKGRSKDPVPNDQYRNTGELARNRWAALARVLPGALSRLTGRQMEGADADWWVEYVRNNKRNLAGVFVDDED
jgi:hypothetical protein